MNKSIETIVWFNSLIFSFLFIFFIFGKFFVKPVYAAWVCYPSYSLCYNGPSNTDSGGCGTPCYDGNPWSQYKWLSACSWAYQTYNCSTADKCDDPKDNALHAGYCDCSLGGIYKVCCSGSTRVACSQLNQDNLPPPEGVCTGTTVYGTSCGSTTPPPSGSCGVNAYNNSCPTGYLLNGSCCYCP